MDDFFGGLLVVMATFLVLGVGVLIGETPNYPDIPKYHEVVGRNFGDTLLVEDSNHIQYYLFTEDGKIVKIKKQ